MFDGKTRSKASRGLSATAHLMVYVCLVLAFAFKPFYLGFTRTQSTLRVSPRFCMANFVSELK